jgi:hypothetical protein
MDAVLDVLDQASCPTTVDELLQTDEGRKVLACVHCGVRPGTSPYGDVMCDPPRRIRSMLRAGMLEKVSASIVDHSANPEEICLQ